MSLTENVQTTSPVIMRDLIRTERDRRAASASLYEFVKQSWSVVEPGVKFIPSWHIEEICEHLNIEINVGEGENCHSIGVDSIEEGKQKYKLIKKQIKLDGFNVFDKNE